MNVRKKLSLAALCFTIPAMASAQAAPAPEAAAAPAAPAAKPAEAKPAAPSVTVYGTFNANIQTTMAKGATDPSKSVTARNAVSIDSSNVGVKASADVGNGLGVTAQCETSAAIDGIGTAGICGRNSRVGLTTPYGTVFLGNWDTPFKAVTYGTKVDDPFMNTDVFGFQSIMGSPGYNSRSGGWSTSATEVIKGFDVRANNSIGFHSAKFADMISFKLQYSASENRAADGIATPELYSAAINLDAGPFSALLAIEDHEDARGITALASNTGAQHTSDAAARLGAGYQLDTDLGATTVSVVAEALAYTQNKALPTGNFIKSYTRPAWQIAAKHRAGNHELRARFNSAGDPTVKMADGSTGTYSTTGLSAKQITVGYAYHLSKSAQAYLSFTKLFNGGNAQYTLTIGGSPAVAGATPKGADPQAVGLGLRYAF